MNDDRVSTALAERAERPDGELSIFDLLQRQRRQIEAAVPRHVSADRLARVALTAIRQTPKLADCAAPSLIGAVMLSAQLGLEIGAPLGQAYLVPFGHECQFILGYKGVIDLAYRSGRMRDIQAREVRDRDTFRVVYGLHPVLEHTPTLRDPGEVVAYWGLANFTEGGHHAHVSSLDEIAEHRERSRAAHAGPWITDPVAMSKKTVIRIMQPFLPMSAELIDQLATDEMVVHDLPTDYRDVIDTSPVIAPPPEPETLNAPDPPKRKRGRPRKTVDADAGTQNDVPSTVSDADDVGTDKEPAPTPDEPMVSKEQREQFVEVLGPLIGPMFNDDVLGWRRIASATVGRKITAVTELTTSEADEVIAALRDLEEQTRPDAPAEPDPF